MVVDHSTQFLKDIIPLYIISIVIMFSFYFVCYCCYTILDIKKLDKNEKKGQIEWRRHHTQ